MAKKAMKWEGSKEDKKADAAGQKKMEAKRKKSASKKKRK